MEEKLEEIRKTKEARREAFLAKREN